MQTEGGLLRDRVKKLLAWGGGGWALSHPLICIINPQLKPDGNIFVGLFCVPAIKKSSF